MKENNHLCNHWLKDSSTKNFLLESNPWVLRDIGERLLEASNRNLWKSANKDELELKVMKDDNEQEIVEYGENPF